MRADLTKQVLLVGFNLDGIESVEGCAMYSDAQLRLHAPGHDPFFAAMLKQLGISSFIRLAGCHYNSLEEIDLFLKATVKLAKSH